MRIAIAYDLKADVLASAGASSSSLPEDAFEEYDSEETVDAIAGAIRAAGHEAVKLGGGRRFVERLLAVTGGGASAVDLVFNIAEGRGSRSREAHVPAVCEMLGVPVTHSDPLTLAVTLDKACAKRVAASHGVRTAPFALIERIEDLDRLPLPPFPLLAKPNWEGSSMGVRKRSKCRSNQELRDVVGGLLSDYRQPVLVEGFLPGVEVTVGILGTGGRARVVGMMECAPRRTKQEDFVYSLEVKRDWQNEVEYHVPPRLPAETLRAIEETALGAYRALDCRDVARVDTRLDAEGRPTFIEVNPLPGLNPTTGDLPILAARSGLPYADLIAAVIRSAEARLPAPAASEAPASMPFANA